MCLECLCKKNSENGQVYLVCILQNWTDFTLKDKHFSLNLIITVIYNFDRHITLSWHLWRRYSWTESVHILRCHLLYSIIDLVYSKEHIYFLVYSNFLVYKYKYNEGGDVEAPWVPKKCSPSLQIYRMTSRPRKTVSVPLTMPSIKFWLLNPPKTFFQKISTQ